MRFQEHDKGDLCIIDKASMWTRRSESKARTAKLLVTPYAGQRYRLVFGPSTRRAERVSKLLTIARNGCFKYQGFASILERRTRMLRVLRINMQGEGVHSRAISDMYRAYHGQFRRSVMADIGTLSELGPNLGRQMHKCRPRSFSAVGDAQCRR